jgi:WD40 repeat protein
LHGDGVESEFQRDWERVLGEKKLVSGWDEEEMESRKRFSSPDGNMLDLLDRRSLHALEVAFPVLEPYARRALQMHSSLVQRLVLQRLMEGHQGCVNSLAWNAQGTLLISGSDDTRVCPIQIMSNCLFSSFVI